MKNKKKIALYKLLYKKIIIIFANKFKAKIFLIKKPKTIIKLKITIKKT